MDEGAVGSLNGGGSGTQLMDQFDWIQFYWDSTL